MGWFEIVVLVLLVYAVIFLVEWLISLGTRRQFRIPLDPRKRKGG